MKATDEQKPSTTESSQTSKTCSACGELKNTSEFSKDVGKPDGLCSLCTECNRIRVNEWRKANPQRKAAADKRWSKANPEKVKTNKQRWLNQAKHGGFVYALVNPAWAGMVKVGKTTSVTNRLATYQTGCPYRAYVVVIAEWFPNHHEAETQIKRRLHRAHHDGEWYAIDSFHVVQEIHNLKREIIGE